MRQALRLLLVSLFSAGARSQSNQPPFRFTPADEKIHHQADEMDRQFEKRGLVYQNPQAEAYLDGIGAGLLGKDASPDRVAYKFRILRDPMVNAFALPNGSIYVNTGLLAALKNEAQLAGVLSHEITHVTNRHTYLADRSIRKKTVTAEVIAAAGAGAGYFPIGPLLASTASFAANVSQVFIVATVFGYSRDLEREADTTGYGRLIRAGYDGAAMSQALEALDERLEFEPIEPFWRTHPKLEERIATAKGLAQRENTSHPRMVSESDYVNAMLPAIRFNIELDLDSQRARTAAARAQRLVDIAPGDAVNRTLLADAYRSLGAKTAKPDGEESSNKGKDANRKRLLQRTAEEEQRDLLENPAGKRTHAANLDKAKSLYEEAIHDDPKQPDPHRGLGLLYEDQHDFSAAEREYSEYLRLAPADAIDRLRIARRLERVRSEGK